MAYGVIELASVQASASAVARLFGTAAFGAVVFVRRVAPMPAAGVFASVLIVRAADGQVGHASHSPTLVLLILGWSLGPVRLDGRHESPPEALLAPSITRRLLEHYIRQPSPDELTTARLAKLAKRELETLRLVAHGLSNAQIAQRHFVAEATVKTHVSHILAKLDLRDRVQAVVFAYETGIVNPGEPSGLA